jgi:hypothetical protein
MDQARMLFLAFVVGIFVVLGAGQVLRRRRQRSWPTVPGTLREKRTSRRGSGNPWFQLRADFRTRDGAPVDAWASNLVGWEARTEPGTEVTVAYDPRNPRRFYVEVPGSKDDDHVGLWVLLVVGVLAFVAVVFFLA